ncbi:GAL11-domain-containing protein [Suhomyces tanzawaensis NRRL Y-17324]
MNNMHQPQGMNSWHSMYAVSDRQKVVQILSNTLRDMQGANYDAQRGATIAQEFEKYTFMKSQSRDEYLRLIKQKIQQLRTNMNNRNGAPMPQQAQGQSQQMAQPLQQQQQQQQQHQPPQQQLQLNMVNARAGSIQGQAGPNMSQNQQKMKPQNMNFLQQQAQARQQSAAQIQAQMRNNYIPGNQQQPQQQQQQQQQPPQVPQQQQQQQQAPQPVSQPTQTMDDNLSNLQTTHQQIQQISNLIRNAPIPPALLSKIPNIPAGVTTWTQVFDCYQKKIIPASAMPLIKEIHNTHLQLAIRQQHQQKLNQNQQRMGQQNPNGPQIPQQQPQQQQPPQQQQQQQTQQQQGNPNVPLNQLVNSNNNTPVMNNMGFNINNLTPQQKQQFLQRQMQQRNSMAGQNPQQMMQPQQQTQQSTIPVPQLIPQPQTQQSHPQQSGNQAGQPKPPNFQITQQDIMKYSADAMTLLSRVQGNRGIQTTLDQTQKESFIRKYILHQKTQLWKQQNGLATANSGSPVMNNQAMNQKRLLQPQPNGSQNQMGQQIPQSLQVPGNQQIPQSQMPNPVQQQLPMMGNMNMGQTPAMKSQVQMNTLSSPLMAQRGGPMNQMQMNNTNAMNPNANFANQTQPQNSQNQQNQQGQQNDQANRLNARNSIAAILPQLTDDMKLRLRQLLEEVSRNNVVLKDVTSLLSAQEKTKVRETMVKIAQQYSNVDNIISYFFILTKITEGTKRLIQMKYMTKNIMENLQRGIYLAGPDLLEKLRSQYQKYFDYVKEQFSLRRQQLQNQQGQGNQGQPQNQAKPVAQNQGQIPMPGNQQAQVNLGPNNAWPSVAPPNQGNNFQQRNANSSPMIPNSNVSPLMGNQMSPAGGPHAAQKQPKPPAPQAKKTPNPPARRKGSNKGPVNVGSIPTPAGTAASPGALTNAIKTPNSIATPQVGQTQSNKNTPTGQSPNYTIKNSVAAPIPTTDADIFTHSKADSKAAKRRELSNSDPEKFFYASLANLLELDDSLAEMKDKAVTVTESTTTSPLITNGKTAKSPLSPASNSGEWTCEIRPAAITSAFRQVDSIRELVSTDVIENCTKMAVDEASQSAKDSSIGIKRDIDMVDDNDDIDNLFSEKKLKVEGSDHDFMYEPVGFDEWKDFVVSIIQ